MRPLKYFLSRPENDAFTTSDILAFELPSLTHYKIDEVSTCNMMLSWIVIGLAVVALALYFLRKKQP